VELLCRPRATEHYINYLKQHYETEKLMDILGYVFAVLIRPIF